MFDFRGVNGSADLIVTNPVYPNDDYRPDWYRWTQDLGVNLMRVQTSKYVATPFSPKYEPNWAANLDAYLETFKNGGVKVVFAYLGNIYPNTEHDLFGIIQGQTPIADAKILTDKLAGDTSQSTLSDGLPAYGNTLGKNFITDSRLWGFPIANEPNITNNADWYVQLLDYVRSKGGKSWIAAPYDNNLGYLTAAEYDQIFGDHSDMIELHYYGESEYVQWFNYGTQPYGQWNSLYDYLLEKYAELISIPRFPPEKCFLGEFGCWWGLGNSEGLSGVTFNDQDRLNIYTAHLNAAKDAGLKNLAFHTLFGSSAGLVNGVPQNDYGIVLPNKHPNYTGFPSWYDPNLASLVRSAYATTSPIPLWLPLAIGVGAAVYMGVKK